MKKILISLALIALVAFGIFAYYATGDRHSPILSSYQEKVAIQSAVYNSTQNSISVYAQAVNDLGSNANVTNIIIKQSGSIVANIPVSYTLNRFTTYNSYG